MSATVYGLVFRSKIGNPSTKLILLALADNANDEGYCYPSIGKLMEKSELSKSQVLRHLQKLEDNSLLKRKSGIGRGNVSEFWLELDAIYKRVPFDQKEKVSFGKKRCHPGQEKVSSEQIKGVICDDANKEEPSLEPSLEFSLAPPEPPKKTLHTEVKEYIDQTYQGRFGTPVTWDGSEAKQLSSLLTANPTWTLPICQRLIDNRYASEGVNGERPRTWLSNLGRYAGGPLDRFGKVMTFKPVVQKRTMTASERARAAAGVQ